MLVIEVYYPFFQGLPPHSFILDLRFKTFIQEWCPYFCQIDLASDTTESFLIEAHPAKDLTKLALLWQQNC